MLWAIDLMQAGLDALDLGESAKAAFLAGNAQRVFKLN
jgi:hypothetical protein